MPQGFQNVKKEVPPQVLYNGNEVENQKDRRDTPCDHYTTNEFIWRSRIV